MFEISDLIAKLNPRQTVLLLGAGASIPSGAPSGQSLAMRLARQLPDLTDPDSFSLSEICSIYERQNGRDRLAAAVAEILTPIEPTKGIQLLPQFDWHKIYSTNFDLLVEKVYAAAKVDIRVICSNFDFSRDTFSNALEYYKIHGTVTQDVGFGHKSRMLLTEEDYETYADFRQAAFRVLAADVVTKDVLVIGQSLNDAHLKELIREALNLRANAGTPGRVFVLAYDRNNQRAQLLTTRGAEVYFGDLNELFSGLLSALPSDELKSAEDDSKFEPTLLPSELIGVTTDIRHASTLDPNARRLFNGAAASYADIARDLTFRRTSCESVLDTLRQKPMAAILGAGGVGKTTLARQVIAEKAQALDAAWEHTDTFPFQAKYWIEYEDRLRRQGKRAVLLIDDCIEHLSQVSQLANRLGAVSDPALQVLMTANTGQWNQRSKSPFIFSHGDVLTLTRLSGGDIENLVELTAQRPEIRELVEQRFLNLPRGEQVRVLRERCGSDMYVCMKNIFASEEIDFILLREYADLDIAAQEIYRNVAAIEATGARVHRQLIMRTFGLEAGGLLSTLNALTGIISEYDISPKNGLYGWETRHRVIARTIAHYKFAAQDHLYALFESLVESINPSVRLEIETAKALCTDEFGIDRLADGEKQVNLLRRVVRLIPGEPIPRHRLIRHLIDQQRLDEATKEWREAVDAVRMNPVLGRYEVLLLIRKAQLTPGLLSEDRRALLLDAEGRALKNIHRYPSDLHAFRIYGDVAVALAGVGGGPETLRDAIQRARDGEARILDPALTEIRRYLEGELRKVPN
jgi:hypothetical protein